MRFEIDGQQKPEVVLKAHLELDQDGNVLLFLAHEDYCQAVLVIGKLGLYRPCVAASHVPGIRLTEDGQRIYDCSPLPKPPTTNPDQACEDRLHELSTAGDTR